MARAVFLLALATVLLVAGCSGSDNGSAKSTSTTGTAGASTTAPAAATTAPRPALSKEAFVQQATAACKEASQQTDFDAPFTSAKEYEDLATRASAAFTQLQSKLSTLAPPPADRQAIQTGLVGFRQQVLDALNGALPAIRGAAAKGDTSAAQSAYADVVSKVSDLQDANDSFLTSYGLADECEFFPNPEFKRVG